MTEGPARWTRAPRRPGLLARLGRGLLWLVELPLAASVAAGLAAAFLPPGPFWWVQLVAVALPYLACVLAAWTVVPLVARRWRVLAVNLGLVGLVAIRALPLGAPVPDVDALQAEEVLNLVTFNVPQAGPSREALGDSAVAFVERVAPDVLALQDVWVLETSAFEAARTDVQVEAVTRRLPYRYHRPEPLLRIHTWHRLGTSVPVLSRSGTDVLRATPVAFDSTAPGRGSAATRVEVLWQGRRLALYNVHLRSFGGEKPWQDPRLRSGPLGERLAPAAWLPYLRQYRDVYRARGDEVAVLARAVAADSLPVVVLGDLNSTADNWSARQLRTAGVPRTDAVRAVGEGWGRTYHARRPLVRIDVVYADPALEVLAAETHAVGFSDHRPVQAWLRWRED